MPLIHLENICKAYGAKPVLTSIFWKIEPGDRIGLVGLNGCGKTTLFHLLTGRLFPDQGSVHPQRSLKVAYLPQAPALECGATVLKTALQGFQGLLDLQDRLKTLESWIASGNAALLEEYGRLRDRYEREGGYASEARAKAILYGLGFREGDLDLQVDLLSGGQKNRLALAQLLSGEPDLLLLDEPTNHLDLQAMEWLEGFLTDCDGAFVVVSHDRYFLDRTVSEIVELEGGRLEHYAGSYTFYAAEKSGGRSSSRKSMVNSRPILPAPKNTSRRI